MKGVEGILSRAGRSHRVETVAIFHVRTRADDGVAARVPRVRMPEPEVVTPLMAGHAGALVCSQTPRPPTYA